MIAQGVRKRSIQLSGVVLALLLMCVAAQAGINGPLTVTASNAEGKWATWSYDWTNGQSS